VADVSTPAGRGGDEHADRHFGEEGARLTYGSYLRVAELLDHDANAALWRSRHVIMVERQIGTKSGTGGSSGAPYLRSRLGLHYYPLLWELRSRL
jgi:tryptophan 2,3-dioxygenase